MKRSGILAALGAALLAFPAAAQSTTVELGIEADMQTLRNQNDGDLRDKFDQKRIRFSEGIRELGFDIYDSGSAFYLWARIPEQYSDAIAFNDMLMRDAGVGMTPGSAFADSDTWDAHVRICIAREDHILDGALAKLQAVLK